MHPAGFKECTIKFEYYSLGFDKETKDSDSKMITQLEVDSGLTWLDFQQQE